MLIRCHTVGTNLVSKPHSCKPARGTCRRHMTAGMTLITSRLSVADVFQHEKGLEQLMDPHLKFYLKI